MVSDGRKRTFSKLKEDQREARRNAIIDAAEEAFATRPFDKVNIRDIAKQAGISPALIYRYFPDQQHLFVEAFLRGTERLVEIFDRFLTTSADNSIEEAAKYFIAFLTEHEQYFKMMTHFMLDGSLDSNLQDRLNTIERTMLERFDRMFEKAGMKEEPRLLSHAFFAALNGVLITFRQHPGRSPEEVREHMNHIGRIIARLFTDAVKKGNRDYSL